MDFLTPPALQDTTQKMEDFVNNEIIPLEGQLAGLPPEKRLEVLSEKRTKAKLLRLWAPNLPEEYGGMGLSTVAFAHLSAVLGRSPLGHYICNSQAPDAGNMQMLLEHGNNEQRQLHLQGLADGNLHSSFGAMDPEIGEGGETSLPMTAQKQGDEYVLNGQMWLLTAADDADFSILAAITHPGAAHHKRFSLLIVPSDARGYDVLTTIPGGEENRGLLHYLEVQLRDCRIPQRFRLGKAGAGLAIAQERLGPSRIRHCMRWIGICERAFDLMLEQAGNVTAPHPNFDGWITESRAEINAARLMVLDAAWKLTREGSVAAREEISLIKFYTAAVLQGVLDRAVELYGGPDAIRNTPLAYWQQYERASRIYDGPQDAEKAAVAKEILEKYGQSEG